MGIRSISMSDPKCKIDAFCASSAGCPYKVFVITDMMSLRKKSVLKMNFFDTRETSSVSWLFRVKCIEVKKRKLTQMVRHNRMNETECAATYPPLHFCVTKIKLTPRKKILFRPRDDARVEKLTHNWRTFFTPTLNDCTHFFPMFFVVIFKILHAKQVSLSQFDAIISGAARNGNAS